MKKIVGLDNNQLLDSNYIAHEDSDGNIETLHNTIENLKEVVLYEDSIGTFGTVTLTDTLENYNKVIINYRNNDYVYSSISIKNPNGKKATLFSGYSGDLNWTNILIKTINLSGTSITRDSEVAYQFGKSCGTNDVSNSNKVYITQVVGYKN